MTKYDQMMNQTLLKYQKVEKKFKSFPSIFRIFWVFPYLLNFQDFS